MDFAKVFMTNPAFLELIKFCFNNPIMLQMLKETPEVKRLQEKNPAFKDLLDKPDFINKLMTPELFNVFLQMYNTKNNVNENNNNININNNINLFKDINKEQKIINGSDQKEKKDKKVLKEKFKILKEIGFKDDKKIKEALIVCEGNLEHAIEYLTDFDNVYGAEDEK